MHTRLCRRPIAVVITVLLGPGAHAAPRSPRATALPAPVTVAQVLAPGGTLRTVVTVTDVAADHPVVVNGVVGEAEADAKLRVLLETAAPGLHGLGPAGAPVPYQRVHARIENLQHPGPDGVVEFDLRPHVGTRAGNTYASHVRLPPVASSGDPAGYEYRLLLTATPAPELPLLADALPASPVWRAAAPVLLVDVRMRLGPLQHLPRRPAPEALALAASADRVSGLFLADQAAAARDEYRANLRPWVRASEPAGPWTDVDAGIVAALAGQVHRGDCGAQRGECLRLLEGSLLRAFLAGALRELDAAQAALATAPDDASAAWDRAYVLHHAALAPFHGAMEQACLAGPPGAPPLPTCALLAPLERAFLDGANAILDGVAPALGAARHAAEALLYKAAAYATCAASWDALGAGADAAFQADRVRARIHARALAHVVGAPADTVDGVLAARDRAAFTPTAAARVLAQQRAGLVPTWLSQDDTCDPTVLAGVTP
ncbi:MAG: hypothetical protein HY904_26535 [Deltaproteobacteria bacterium]|nr:hypothetical protein [Deltaproteobacteria bacterium]